MEGESEYKHSCRYCKKKFMCGRALGGHMRSHMTMPCNETTENHQKMNGDDGQSDEMRGVEGRHQGGGYGLRENPKKTLRFSDSATRLGTDAKLCKECGKGFPSWKALFGHMKCHSEKCSLDEGSCVEVQNALDDHSDGETVPKKRTKRRALHTAPSPLTDFRRTNSSHVCGFDREQEEVAISLMMLSRGTSRFLDFGRDCASKENFGGTSDKSFVSKCSSRFKKPTKMIDFDNGGSKRKPFKTHNAFVGTELNGSADNERSGNAFRESTGGRKKVGVSAEIESGWESDYESQGDYQVLNSELDSNSSKMVLLDRRNFDSGKHPHKRARIGLHTSNIRKQKPVAGYECTSCKKLFHSYQALGGHRASHKGVKSCYHMLSNGSSVIEGDETNTIMINQQISSIGNFLDLNLPASDEHESNDGHTGSSCWSSSNGLTQSAPGKEGRATYF